jgi:thiamine biosynthesis lipoprotein
MHCITATFLLFVFITADRQSALKAFEISGPAQGTTYHITYFAEDSVVLHKSIDSIFEKIDSSLSLYRPYSLINRFNNAASEVEMDEHLRKVVTASLRIYRSTAGVSDLTVYPLVKAWGFGPEKTSTIPDSAQIKEILKCVGANKIRIEGNNLVKDLPCVKIDLNGIAQGYTVDLIADFLEKKSIQNYLVEVGGEIRLKGKKYPGPENLKVGIESPTQNVLGQSVIYKILQPGSGAITTSGNYRKYHISDGKNISHLVDPVTGYPFSNELISVTVFARDAITADGYDNALMGMGLKKALQFMKSKTEMEAYFIYRKENGTVADTSTSGFNKLTTHQ